MIDTKIISSAPLIIHHQVSGDINEAEAVTGASNAVTVLESIAPGDNEMMLLLDMRGCSFVDLKAHKQWSIGFKEKDVLQNNVSKVALISDSTPRVAAEKEIMESESLRYFEQFEEAISWLKSV